MIMAMVSLSIFSFVFVTSKQAHLKALVWKDSVFHQILKEAIAGIHFPNEIVPYEIGSMDDFYKVNCDC